MAKFIEKPDSNSVIFLDKEAFYRDLKKELSRISRYGHRASFMLIEVEIFNEISEDYLAKIYQKIKGQLRTCDSLYFFSPPCTFAAILPDTHEGGGECAALRLKQIISQAEGPDKRPMATSVGLISVGQEALLDPDRLLNALDSDLERDKTCQILPRQSVPPERQIKVALLPESIDGFSVIRKKIEPFCTVVKWAKANAFDLISEKTRCVAVLYKDQDLQHHIHTLEFLRKDRGLKNIYKILLGTPEDFLSDFNLVVPAKCDPEFLSYSILKAFNSLKKGQMVDRAEDKRYTHILSSISAATHQLNQPLQIILGKIELLMLDLDSGRTQDTRQILSEIRDQVLYSADINQKINRLTKL